MAIAAETVTGARVGGASRERAGKRGKLGETGCN